MTWRRYKLNLRNSLLLEEYFWVMKKFDSTLSSIIDSTLGLRCRLFGYQYSEIIRSLMSIYFRANRCSSLYNDIFTLKGWKTEEINGIEFELNSILVEKWKGKSIPTCDSKTETDGWCAGSLGRRIHIPLYPD